MKLPLEENIRDIVAKAELGLNRPANSKPCRTEDCRLLAPTLRLGAEALVASLSLPDDTVICPGHGPLTTVGEEKRHNPFFTT